MIYYSTMFFAILLSAVATFPYPSVTPSEFQSGEYDKKRVQMSATIVEAFVDELDPGYVFFVLRNSGEDVYAYICRRFLSVTPESLVGAEVLVWGTPHRPNPTHLYAQRQFDIPMADAFVVTRPAPDPFAAPDLSTARKCMPAELSALGRRTTRGEVIAVWNSGRSILLASGDNRARVDISTANPPAVGDRIMASGMPETDLRNLNLSRAVWREDDSTPTAELPSPRQLSLRQMHTNKDGARAFMLEFHGRPVRISANVRSLPGEKVPGRFTCGYGSFDVTVDASAADAMPPLNFGDTIEVEGIALCECRNFRPNEPFPQILGYTIVPRSAAGIRVTAHASRPLPDSAWYVLGALLTALGVAMLWNMSLKRQALKRGTALAREQIARAEADLKTVERTRISVELHDTIAQNLTGVAFEIETATRTQSKMDDAVAAHLSRAASMLASCRSELRNCLWDLRNDALEEKDMESAIRRALLPHVKGITLQIRFNVERKRISDNTTHAILQIVRELAVNGIRHGGADSIHIAGTIDGEELLVSVRDNGRGFDTEKAPGVDEGHFGLDGIRSRVEKLSGAFEIESSLGHGTRAMIRIPIPAKEQAQ